jgi:hypothetical protein
MVYGKCENVQDFEVKQNINKQAHIMYIESYNNPFTREKPDAYV